VDPGGKSHDLVFRTANDLSFCNQRAINGTSKLRWGV